MSVFGTSGSPVSQVSHTLSEGQLTGVSVNDCLVSAIMRTWDIGLVPRLTTEAILKSNREVEARVAEIRRQHAGRPIWLYLGAGIHLGGSRLMSYFVSCRGCSGVIQTRVHHKGCNCLGIRVKRLVGGK